jgi:nucleotide-binding universal stress UspA family protein
LAAAAATLVASRLSDTELWLVHVLDPTMSSLDASAFESVKEAARKRLREEADGLSQNVGVTIHHAVLTGSASASLLAFAASKQATLIIVTSQGHGDSPFYRVGGTSERLVQSAEIPVLVVRDPAPFEAWANGERRLRVLLAVDWTESCEAAIRWVKGIRAAGPCDVVVGYVYYSDFTGEGAGRSRGGMGCRGATRWSSAIWKRSPCWRAILPHELGTSGARLPRARQADVLRGCRARTTRPSHREALECSGGPL